MKTIRCVQLNVQERGHGDALMNYIQTQQFDVMMVQEIGTGIYSTYGNGFNPFDRLKSQGYYVLYAPQFDLDDGSGSRGNAIVSRFPVVNYKVWYDSGASVLPLQSRESLGLDLDVSIYENRKKKRALERDHPYGVLVADIQIGLSIIRFVTTHFRASPQCTENEDMLACSNFLVGILSAKPDFPTVLSGDFNIHQDAKSIAMIKNQGFSHLNQEHHTTLNPRLHPGFKNDIPQEGYMVDHVFGKDIAFGEYLIPQIDVSDHLPIEYTLKVD